MIQTKSKLNIDEIPFDDQSTWDFICSGYTKGIFQCESKLVQLWLRKIKPRNLWELSIVIALVRPGPLKSGFADKYLAYRNQTEEPESFGHETIDYILSSTNHCLIFQETLMMLGSKLAWSHLSDKEKGIKVDTLRKGVGKKDQKKLMEIGKDFVEGCVLNKVDQAVADKLFTVIQNCGRYMFNLSHSMKYAIVAYQTAYLKAHYPLQFMATYLTYTKFKMKKWEEMESLMEECRILGIEILPPNINSKNAHFQIEDGKIRYGITHIKDSEKDISTYLEYLHDIKNLHDFIKFSFTTDLGYKPSASFTRSLICVGAFSDVGISRQLLLQIFNILYELTNKEFISLVTLINSSVTPEELVPTLSLVSKDFATKKRKEKVESYSELLKLHLDIKDPPGWIEAQETNLLGTFITASAVEFKTTSDDRCLDLYDESIPVWAEKNISAVIDTVKITTIKNGKNTGKTMAIIDVHDSTANFDRLPIFSEKYEEFSDIIIEKNMISLNLKKGTGGWFVESMRQI